VIENIETLTSKEYLRQQIKEGKVPAGIIHAGERIDFSPNSLTVKKSYGWKKNRIRILGGRYDRITQNDA